MSKIIRGDCKDYLGAGLIKSNSIDLIITSPPYKNEDGFKQAVNFRLMRLLYCVLKPNHLFFLNLNYQNRKAKANLLLKFQ